MWAFKVRLLSTTTTSYKLQVTDLGHFGDCVVTACSINLTLIVSPVCSGIFLALRPMTDVRETRTKKTCARKLASKFMCKFLAQEKSNIQRQRYFSPVHNDDS